MGMLIKRHRKMKQNTETKQRNEERQAVEEKQETDYSQFTVAELKEKADQAGIDGYSNMKKSELINALAGD